MKHNTTLTPQFYVTAPQPCPYLADRMERKLFTALQDGDGAALNDALSKQGFRRSQNVLYRPSCAECSACMSARIDVTKFTPTRSQKRITKRNADMARRPASTWATEEQFDLFRIYLDSRHADGGMADMDFMEFSAMVEETPIRSRMVEYFTRKDTAHHGHLTSVCLTDILEDGLSMVYSFYDPEFHAKSLGTYMILDHIELAREMALPYVYLGYWVPGSAKMGYKANFSGLEIYHGGEWKPLTNPEDYAQESHPLNVDPIAEQVARISLPR